MFAAEPPIGQSRNLVNPPSLQKWLVLTVAVCLSFAMLFIALRMFVKSYVVKKVEIEDCMHKQSLCHMKRNSTELQFRRAHLLWRSLCSFQRRFDSSRERGTKQTLLGPDVGSSRSCQLPREHCNYNLRPRDISCKTLCSTTDAAALSRQQTRLYLLVHPSADMVEFSLVSRSLARSRR